MAKAGIIISKQLLLCIIYHALETEFILFEVLYNARNKAGLTQEEMETGALV